MTSKEKAKQLKINMFEIVSSSYYASQCALICVEEILKLPCLTDEGWLNVPQEYKIQYWNEVKKEIEGS